MRVFDISEWNFAIRKVNPHLHFITTKDSTAYEFFGVIGHNINAQMIIAIYEVCGSLECGTIQVYYSNLKFKANSHYFSQFPLIVASLIEVGFFSLIAACCLQFS